MNCLCLLHHNYAFSIVPECPSLEREILPTVLILLNDITQPKLLP